MIFSQSSLTPKIINEKSDTLFCFSVAQAKILAKNLQKVLYYDSLQNSYNRQKQDIDCLLAVKDSLIDVQKEEILEKDTLINLSQNERLLLEDEVLDFRGQIKWMERERKIYRIQTSVFGLLVLTVSILGLVK